MAVRYHYQQLSHKKKKKKKTLHFFRHIMPLYTPSFIVFYYKQSIAAADVDDADVRMPACLLYMPRVKFFVFERVWNRKKEYIWCEIMMMSFLNSKISIELNFPFNSQRQ